ncbi:hypothetical protein [Arvimicrobium flavum]|uniref:hypothetical protein n=1 Tax=Arvimicrobium flavum TaxID=3393320 RepID=UPI00237BA7D3|nr:hypothetical protein [Mesorhizobium shangrilense]
MKPLQVIGWLTGFLLSIVLSGLTAPQNLDLPFWLGGTFSGIAGFVLAAIFRKWASARVTAIALILFLIVGLGSAAYYMQLLHDAQNTTPSKVTEWLEFFLFCVAHFGLIAVLGLAYLYGAPWLLRKIGGGGGE